MFVAELQYESLKLKSSGLVKLNIISKKKLVTNCPSIKLKRKPLYRLSIYWIVSQDQIPSYQTKQ